MNFTKPQDVVITHISPCGQSIVQKHWPSSPQWLESTPLFPNMHRFILGLRLFVLSTGSEGTWVLESGTVSFPIYFYSKLSLVLLILQCLIGILGSKFEIRKEKSLQIPVEICVCNNTQHAHQVVLSQEYMCMFIPVHLSISVSTANETILKLISIGFTGTKNGDSPTC